jgi:Flp pilus assembly protein TadG
MTSGFQLKRMNDRGVSLIEFALVLPFFMVFVMGIVEFGRGFNIYHNITNACREGARLAATRDNKQITLTAANIVRARVVNYMTNVGLQTSPYTGTGALDSSTPPAQSATDYIYGSRSGAYLVIDQGETIRQTDTSGNVVLGGINYLASRVELRYPYTVPMFSKVIRLLIPSASATGTIYITSSTVIEN